MRVRPDLRLTAFINRSAAAEPGPWRDVPSVTVPVNARNRLAWVLASSSCCRRAAVRAGVDLLHSLANTGPAWGRFRRVVTNARPDPRDLPRGTLRAARLGMRILVPLRRGARTV